MQLERLSIWKDYNGAFDITVEFKSKDGEVKLKLPPELNQRILAVCADEMTKAVGRAANELTAQIVDHAQAALPAE